MAVLVTGGFGYIGSHITRLLQQSGQEVHVLDNADPMPQLQVSGSLRVDLSQEESVRTITEYLQNNQIDSIIHMAARKQVGESVEKPLWYYRQNIGGLTNLLEAAVSAGVSKFVFSSSAATYGTPPGGVAAESGQASPINPYGETKLIGEWLMRNVEKATGLKQLSLRYFNVAGAGWDDLGDPHALNLIPIIFRQIDRGEQPIIFGDDYDTPDGTCVRDYIHILDLAQAHIDALGYLERDDREFDVFNVGTGKGTSVAEVVAEVSQVTGVELNPVITARRAGDPASLTAAADRIQSAFGWKAQYGLTEIIQSGWDAHRHRSLHR